MAIAEGVKAIVQDIVSSREVRVAEVKGLKKEAAEMLGALEASRAEMGAQLRQDLAHDKAKMRAKVKALRSGFQSSHKKMGTHLRKELADYDRGIKSEVAGMLGALEASLAEMGAQLRQDLAHDRAKMGAEVEALRSGFQSSHKKMGTHLRKELADYDHEIKSEVAGMRQETIADLGEARTAWQLVASNGHAKIGRAEILPKEEARVDKEAPGASKKRQTRPGLEGKLQAAVNEHPEGITLTEVAANLGVAPIVLARTVKSLLDRELIRKKSNLYLPARAK